MSALSPLLVQATPVKAVRGEGVWLFDEEGRRYWVYRAGLYDREAVTPRWYLHGLFG